MQLGDAVQEITEGDSNKFSFYRPVCVCVCVKDCQAVKVYLGVCLHMHDDGFAHGLMYFAE